MDPVGDVGGDNPQQEGANPQQEANPQQGAHGDAGAQDVQPGCEIRDSQAYICLSLECAAAGHINCQMVNVQAQEPAQEPAQDPPQDLAQEPAQDLAQEPAQDPA